MENNESMNNQVNESNNVEQEKKNNSKTIGIVVLVIGLLLVCFAGYKLFIEKPESTKPKDDNTQEQDNNNVVVDKNTYKTADGKFILKIVEKNDSKAAEEAKKLGEDTVNEAKYYAYFNDTILAITDVYQEDNHYATYGFSGYENAEANGYSLVVNKDINVLEINPIDLTSKDQNCMKENFCSFPHHMSFIKSDLGYFFIDESYGDNVLYTTSWKKLGYVYIENGKLKEADSTGVTVYSDRNAKECDGNMCNWELSNPTKYDVNGNIINN